MHVFILYKAFENQPSLLYYLMTEEHKILQYSDMTFVFFPITYKGKGDREMIPMNDLGPGKRRLHARAPTTSNHDTS